MPIEITHRRTHNGTSSAWKPFKLTVLNFVELEGVRKSVKKETACKFVDFCYICKLD